MKDFKSSMNKIQMEEELRTKIISALREHAKSNSDIKQNVDSELTDDIKLSEHAEPSVVANRASTKKSSRLKYGISLAAVFLICFIGIGAYTYSTPIGYMDMDTNPAIELTVNRFDRVIDSRAYNKDGENLLGDVKIKHKKIEDAVQVIFDDLVSNGLLNEAGLLSVAITADDKSKEKELQDLIDAKLNKLISGISINCNYDVVAVDGKIKIEANKHHMSAPKYIAISELKKVDETATYKDCKNNTIPEIHKRTEDCKNEHQQKQTQTQKHKNDGSKHDGTGNSNSNGSSSSSSKKSGSQKHSGSSGTGSGSGSGSGSGNGGSDGSGTGTGSGSGSGSSGHNSGDGSGGGHNNNDGSGHHE